MLIKKIISAAVFCAFLVPLTALAPRDGRMMVLNNVTDYYDFRLYLKVPVIVDNMESQGYRKFKRQELRGTLTVHYFENHLNETVFDMSIPALTNKHYKIRGANVTYETTVGESPVWVAIGNNRTGVFHNSCIAIDIDANPSYNVGDDEPDNTLILKISGRGNQFSMFSGFAAGQIGCGCHAYGHISPTRQLGPQGATDKVQDIAACFGQFRMKWVGYEVD